MAEGAPRWIADRVFAGFEVTQGAHDIAEADAATLPGQAVAAAGPADADKDALAHQLLQHRFEIAPRDAFALGDLDRTDRGDAPVIGDVEDRLDRKQELFGELNHDVRARRPPAYSLGVGPGISSF